MVQIHHRTCNICEANCGLLIAHDGSHVLSIKGDPDNALSRGHICPKAVALQDLQDDPDRLRKPVRRIGDQWTEITWQQAFTEIGQRTRAILGQDPKAAAIYRGNPNVHNYGNMLNGNFLVEALGQPQRYSASTVDQIPTQVASLRMLGHAMMWGVPDIDRTETLIVIGANPMASNGSLWTVPDFKNRAKALKTRGGTIVTIDPRRTETSRLADRHLFIRPATDVFLLAALLQAVLRRTPQRPVHQLAVGLEQLSARLAHLPIDACAKACGIDPADIAWLADKLSAGPSAIYGRMGVSVQEHGTLNAWLINLINIATGNFDREGGIIFGRPAIDNTAAPSPTVGTMHSRVSGHRDSLGEFPSAALAEEIETPGPGQIRALFVIAGNPTLSVPNGRRLAEAISTLDLFVAVDMYRNATTRLAHYILPPTGPLERDHYGLGLLPAAVRNFATYSQAMIQPEADALHDWQILRGLAEAVGGKPILAPPPHVIIDGMLANGPYSLSVDQLKANPSGIDLGPCIGDMLPSRIKTESGMIECAPAEFLEAIAGLQLPSDTADGTLFLISRRHLRSNNSWLGNSNRLVKGADRCTIEINPSDAEERQLEDGSWASVTNGDRSIRARISVTDNMMPGCISLPHGWGHDLPGVAMGVAQDHPGASINDITDDGRLDPLSGNAALTGVRVRLERV